MRTTLTLGDDVADALRERARLRDRSFRQVVNEALRRGLSPAAPEDRPAFRVRPLPGGLRPGVDPLRLDQLADGLEAEDFRDRTTG